MDAYQPHDSRSSSNRRVLIDRPNQQLIDAIRAQVALPAPDARGHWEVGGVRLVEAQVQITRVTHHATDMTAEQPIIWDDPFGR